MNRPPAPWIDQSLKQAMKEREEVNKLKNDRQNLALQTEHKEKKRAKYVKDEFDICGNDATKKWKVVKKLIPENSKKF